MENDQPQTHTATSRAQAEQALQTLDADRASLSDQLMAPPWYYPVLAVITAGYVASPAINNATASNIFGGILIGVYVALLLTSPRIFRVRVGRTGPRATMIMVGLSIAVLLMLSVSLALVSLLSAWWVLVPSIGCFVVTLGAGQWFDRTYRARVRHGQ